MLAVFEDVAGRQPGRPWTEHDLTAVFERLARPLCSVDPASGLKPVTTLFRDDFAGWSTLRDSATPARSVEQWLDERTLDTLVAIESTWTDAAASDVVTHNDVRADNLLIDDGGQVWLLDWAQAGFAGHFTEAARRPPVPQIPMLRAFQEAQGVQARAWAAERLGLLEH